MVVLSVQAATILTTDSTDTLGTFRTNTNTNFTNLNTGTVYSLGSVTGTISIATSTDTNLGLNIATSTGQLTFTPIWIGTLADARITSAGTWNAKQSAITLASSTTGTDFSITNADPVWTFNLPSASASNRGLLTSANWTTFNGKQDAISFPIGYASTTGVQATLSFPLVYASTTHITATTPLIITSGVLSMPTSTTAVSGYLSDTDWNTFNNKVSMVYPGSGIGLSTGAAWGTSITDNSTNWNTAYTDRLKWDGGATGLTAATGRTSLELGSMALLANTGSSSINYVGTIGNGIWQGTPIAYNYGGTGTSTALALQNLWWGNGSGGLVQVASSTLAGAGGGITSLNALTGATQTFATSSGGTAFTLTSAGTIHTLQIPFASSSITGLLTASDYTSFNNKLSTSTAPPQKL